MCLPSGLDNLIDDVLLQVIDSLPLSDVLAIREVSRDYLFYRQCSLTIGLTTTGIEAIVAADKSS